MADTKKLILIKHAMTDLEYVWTQNADLRLGQLMENLFGCSACMHARDDKLVAAVLREARDKGLISDAGTDDSKGMV